MRMPIATRTSRGCVLMTSTIGFGASVPVSLTRWNAGDSMIRMRMKRPTPTSTIENRNGMRQPQEVNCASVVSACMRANTTVERAGRPGRPSAAKLP